MGSDRLGRWTSSSCFAAGNSQALPGKLSQLFLDDSIGFDNQCVAVLSGRQGAMPPMHICLKSELQSYMGGMHVQRLIIRFLLMGREPVSTPESVAMSYLFSLAVALKWELQSYCVCQQLCAAAVKQAACLLCIDCSLRRNVCAWHRV